MDLQIADSLATNKINVDKNLQQLDDVVRPNTGIAFLRVQQESVELVLGRGSVAVAIQGVVNEALYAVVQALPRIVTEWLVDLDVVAGETEEELHAELLHSLFHSELNLVGSTEASQLLWLEDSGNLASISGCSHAVSKNELGHDGDSDSKEEVNLHLIMVLRSGRSGALRSLGVLLGVFGHLETNHYFE